ncbi:alpha/beta fold hydrolase [Methylobrevis pamukkalensis]|uniref:Haloacetate dehalogenase H-1 n=1 Tax=Methylobrevis pamukkalensis TaxID=1439726 RepID=A0A1E3GZM1_9HYPH|nr:alpha/beta hydrolase [Methylobrevis pamukkalensis]ODN69528.1 Haloacetate dehalogenase H-1 [Methylobrevis pamukkalensis]
MPTFTHQGIDLSYLDEGEGDPVLLIHGFASNKMINWSYTGWVTTLTKAGYRAIALDNRGHGESTKLYDPEAYSSETMAEDARALLDHLGIQRADVMGYSMGARIAAFLCLNHQERVRSVVFGGLGIGMVTGVGGSAPIVEALEAASLDEVTDPVGRTFRAFADQTKSDRMALAACMRAMRKKLAPEQVGSIQRPALVAVGSKDEVAGSAAELAALLPNGRALDITGRDHMLAVGDKIYKAGVLEFLAARP